MLSNERILEIAKEHCIDRGFILAFAASIQAEIAAAPTPEAPTPITFERELELSNVPLGVSTPEAHTPRTIAELEAINNAAATPAAPTPRTQRARRIGTLTDPEGWQHTGTSWVPEPDMAELERELAAANSTIATLNAAIDTRNKREWELTNELAASQRAQIAWGSQNLSLTEKLAAAEAQLEHHEAQIEELNRNYLERSREVFALQEKLVAAQAELQVVGIVLDACAEVLGHPTCLAELPDELETIRNDTLEEAAKVCDELKWGEKAEAKIGFEMAKTIRAMKRTS